MKKSFLVFTLFLIIAQVSFSQDIFTSENKNGKWGFIDAEGKEVIPHIYEKADCFYMGYASVVLNGKMGLVDLKGKVIVPFEYDNDLMYFEEGLAVVKKADKYGYVDKNGDVVIEIKYDEALDVSNGKVKVKLGEKWLFLDKTGEKIEK